MTDRPAFDQAAAHRFFSAECYNRAWDLIGAPTRSAAEDEQMLLRAYASFYHWTQRADCTAENRCISLWQISRVFALLGQVENSRRYGAQCLAESDAPDVPLFCLGFAYEALARAEMVAGERERMGEYLALAQQVAARIDDDEDRQVLLKDLSTLQ
jgi:hypothetical protein